MKLRLSDFHFLLESISEPFDNFSISTSEGKCLKVKTQFPYLTLGLMQAPQLIKAFFPLTEGSIFFHNEPTLGCTQFGSVQFVFSQSGFIFCFNKKFSIPWGQVNNCSQDFIKIPPFPIVEKGKINDFIFESLKSNKAITNHFINEMKQTLGVLLKFKDQFQNLVKASPQLFTKDVCQKYLEECYEEVNFKLKQKVFSQAQAEIPFLSTDLLKLKLVSDEMGIKIDFQGTSPSSQIALTDLFTDGVCFNILSHYFQFSHKMNSATFSLFQIAKPVNSFVSSKNTNMLILAENWGAPLLKTALHNCLWKMYGKNQTAPHNYFALPIQLKSDSGTALNFNLNNGRSFYTQNNYNQDKGYFSKNNSDGSLFPKISAFEELGIKVIALEERPVKVTKAAQSSSPGWILKVRTTQKIQLSYFPDIVARSIKIDKLLTGYEASQIVLNGEPLVGKNLSYEIPENSELVFMSGFSSSVI